MPARGERAPLLADEDGKGAFDGPRESLDNAIPSKVQFPPLFASMSIGDAHKTQDKEASAGDQDAMGVQPKLPPPTALQRACILGLWFSLGVTNAFPGVAVRFFMINDLRADPHLQALVGVVTSFAWNFKMMAAFTSDCVPICGYRRRPYLYIGLVLYCASYFALGAFPPGLAVATACLGLASLGQMVMGVMCDTLIVENMRGESDAKKGDLQTYCWVLLALGGVLGTLAGAFVVQVMSVSNRRLFAINAMIKLIIIPFVALLVEPRVRPEDHTDMSRVVKIRAVEMWQAVQQNRIWKPTVFIFIFSVIPNVGSVMPVYFVVELGFSETELSYIMVVGGISGALGIYLYGRFFKNSNWHWFFAVVICASSLLSLTVLVLIFRVNRRWGVPDLAFALGDDAILDVTNSLLSMPILILIASICPPGVESSVYALVTSVQVAGGTVGGTLSATLIEAFGVTLTDFSRLWQLVLLCALLKLLAVPIIPLLPLRFDRNRVEVTDNTSRSRAGAVALLVLLGGGICWALGQAVFKLHQG